MSKDTQTFVAINSSIKKKLQQIAEKEKRTMKAVLDIVISKEYDEVMK